MVQEGDYFVSFLYTAACRAYSGHVATAELLIDAKANVNEQCEHGQTPLLAAVMCGFDALVQVLLAQPRIMLELANDFGLTPLHRAAAHTGIAQQLVTAKASANHANADGDTALSLAAAHGDAAVVRLLLQHKADVNHRNNYSQCSLYHAASRASDDILTALLEADAVVEFADGPDHASPLQKASALGQLPTLNLLVTAVLKDADRARQCAILTKGLHCAVRVGHVEAADTLLKAGADPNGADEHLYGYTPLIDAAEEGLNECIALLLAAKADPNGTDNHGSTALMAAADRGRNETIPLLLGAKANINQANGNGETALISAISSHVAQTTSLLLDSGADWTIKGEQSARQLAHCSINEIQQLFACSQCDWAGMCCTECRTRFCTKECDKFSG